MPLLAHHSFLLPPTPSLPAAAKRSSPRWIRSRSAAMSGQSPSPVLEFPYLPQRHRELMVDLLSAVEARLGPELLPSPEALSFQNPAATSFGALDIRSGGADSSVDFILGSWLHCKLPTGALNITTLFAFLNTSTDAPHLLMEFIQGTPTSLIIFMDLLPRKDLVFHPEYLAKFYQDTNLEQQRQELEKSRHVHPYRSSSLYIRSVLSPTAIAVNIDCGADGEDVIEEIVGAELSSVAKEVLQIWLDKCATSSKQLEETERAVLIGRDNLMKNKTVEIDLAANLPRMFGPDVAAPVVARIQKAFRI